MSDLTKLADEQWPLQMFLHRNRRLACVEPLLGSADIPVLVYPVEQVPEFVDWRSLPGNTPIQYPNLATELAEVRKERDALEALIADHNFAVLLLCDARTDCGAYKSRGLECPDCPKDYFIERDQIRGAKE